MTQDPSQQPPATPTTPAAPKPVPAPAAPVAVADAPEPTPAAVPDAAAMASDMQWFAYNAPQAFAWLVSANMTLAMQILQTPGFFDQVRSNMEPRLHDLVDSKRGMFGLPPVE